MLFSLVVALLANGASALVVQTASRSARAPTILHAGDYLGSLETTTKPTSTSIFMDEAAMIAAAGFPLNPTELIDLAKKFLMSKGGFGADPELLAPEFNFFGPVVGPLAKQEFVDAIGSVQCPTRTRFSSRPIQSARVGA